MKNKVLKLALFTSVLFTGLGAVAAEKQDVKCHVSLLGGNQTIFFGLLKKQSMQAVALDLERKMIMTTISAKKQKVYEVFECVLQEQKFSNANARMIESQIEM